MPKKKIAVISDVYDWAWGRKARQLQMHLSDEFDVEVHYSSESRSVVNGIPIKVGFPGPGYDLYHTFEFPQVGNTRLLGGKGIRIVSGITAHVLTTWERPIALGGKQLNGIEGPGTVAKTCEHLVACHANSLLLQRELQAGNFSGGKKVYYVPNGVDADFWRRTRPRKKSTRLMVGYVGKPIPRKGYDIIREAVGNLGMGAELCEVRRSSKNAISGEEMREFYQDLHVLVVASDYDGTPNPMFEAACCEVTTISNLVGNAPEFITHGHNGLLMPNLKPEGRIPQQPTVAQVTEQLKWAKSHMYEIEEMGKKARQEVLKNWTWQKQAENYRLMWRELTNG